MITAVIVFVLFFAVQVVCGMAALLFSNIDKIGSELPLDQLSIQPTTMGISLLVGEGILAFGLFWWFFKIEKPIRQRSIESPELNSIFKFKPLKRELYPQNIQWIKGFLAVIATLLIAIGVSGVIEHLNLTDNGTSELFNNMKDNPWCWLLMCFVGPLAEELTFRVGILRSLYRIKINGLLSAAITALLFALVHANLAQGITAFLIGFLLGLMYLRTGNLQLCLPTHILNNSVAVLLMFYPNISINIGFSSVFVIIGILLFALAIQSKRSPIFINHHS